MDKIIDLVIKSGWDKTNYEHKQMGFEVNIYISASSASSTLLYSTSCTSTKNRGD